MCAGVQLAGSSAEAVGEADWSREQGHLAPGVSMRAALWGILSESKSALLDAALAVVSIVLVLEGTAGHCLTTANTSSYSQSVLPIRLPDLIL